MTMKSNIIKAFVVTSALLIIIASVIWVDVIKGINAQEIQQSTCTQGCVQYQTLVCDESNNCEVYLVDACVEQNIEGICYTWEVSRTKKF